MPILKTNVLQAKPLTSETIKEQIKPKIIIRKVIRISVEINEIKIRKAAEGHENTLESDSLS